MRVKCVKNINANGEPDLDRDRMVGKTFDVLEISFDRADHQRHLVRIARTEKCGEASDTALFDGAMFEYETVAIPSNWYMSTEGSDSLIIAPKQWSIPGFWEDFYDGNQEAVKIFDEQRQLIRDEENMLTPDPETTIEVAVIMSSLPKYLLGDDSQLDSCGGLAREWILNLRTRRVCRRLTSTP